MPIAWSIPTPTSMTKNSSSTCPRCFSAADAGVHQIITIATTATSSAACVALAERHPELLACVGIQPNNVAEAAPTDWDEVVRLVGRPRVVAVGETGLDRHWDYTPFPQQEDYFARHLELARKHHQAVVIHCREAEADVVRMLRADYDRHGSVRAVMHSFTGDVDTAASCLEMGLFISFAGMVTYKNAEALRDVAKTVPLDRLLVETDSPYLAPVPVPAAAAMNRRLSCIPQPAWRRRDIEPGRNCETTTCNAIILFWKGATTVRKRQVLTLPHGRGSF